LRAAALAAGLVPVLHGGRGGGRCAQVARRGLLEPVILGAAAVAFLSRPKTAPGPSERLVVREERARRDLSSAKEMVTQARETQERLQDALEALSKVEEELREAKQDMEDYPVPDYLQASHQQGKVMIAVTGASGVGKSSWINAVRRMRPKDAGAAKTGITETTLQPEMFAFPPRQGLIRRTFGRVLDKGLGVGRSLLAQNEPEDEPIQVGDRVLLRGVGGGFSGQVADVVAKDGPSSWDVRLADGSVIKAKRDQLTGVLAECVIWDLPGVGTPNCPQATYIKDMGIRYFDVVVLMTATRFTEAELMLVKELQKWKVPFFLVRNKTDSDVLSEIELEEDEVEEMLSGARRKEVAAGTVQTIKDYFRSEFDLNHIYCISTKRRLWEEFDFRQLEEDLEKAIKIQRTVDDP